MQVWSMRELLALSHLPLPPPPLCNAASSEQFYPLIAGLPKQLSLKAAKAAYLGAAIVKDFPEGRFSGQVAKVRGSQRCCPYAMCWVCAADPADAHCALPADPPRPCGVLCRWRAMWRIVRASCGTCCS